MRHNNILCISSDAEWRKLKNSEKCITTVFYDTLHTFYICPNPGGYRTFSFIFLLPQNGEKSFSTKCTNNLHCFKIVPNIKHVRINTYFCIMLVNAIICYCTKSFFPAVYIKSNTVINL